MQVPGLGFMALLAANFRAVIGYIVVCVNLEVGTCSIVFLITPNPA